MPPTLKKDKEKWKIAGETRRSQIVSTYGPGALVDYPRLSGIMAGIDSWNIFDGSLPANAQFSERNLQKMLGKDFFVQVSTEENSDNPFAVPVIRFPQYYYCPNCHKLDRYKQISTTSSKTSDYNKVLYCSDPKCKIGDKLTRLIPSRFIAACPNGHIADFPYDRWVHRNYGYDPEQKHELFLEYRGNTGGLDSIQIRCTCGAKESMSGSMDKDALAFMDCTGTMPWLGGAADRKGWYKDPNGCHAKMRTMQRSANNVYYPVAQSALTIPPHSSKVRQIIQKYKDSLEEIFSDDEEDYINRSLKRHYKRHEKEYRCSESAFIKEAWKFFRDDDDTEITEAVLRIGEYSAFCDVDRNEEGDFFKTRSSDVPEELQEYITSIKIVSRIREVKVLRGFRRIFPAQETDPDKKAEMGLGEQEFSPISKQPLNWLPAIQMFGEGIFIQLNEEAVKKWEEDNAERYKGIGNRMDMPWLGNGMFIPEKPRYILLHTIAHLLIRQLTSQCGYVSASLREKLYSTFKDSSDQMCGILIYTSSTDCDGSLGGLSREGEGYRLGNTILTMLEEATWCSNDPICVDSKGQGYKSLNLAACHACTLLPETSCESNNCLLDRAAVVGTPENRNIGYFSGLLD